MLPGETLLSGAELTCSDCQRTPELQVCHSFAGYYIGAWCDCGPYSRESEYFASREEALAWLPAFIGAFHGGPLPATAR